MWKLLAVPFVAALIAVGSGQAQASPARNMGLQEVASGVTLAAHKGNRVWKRYPRSRSSYNRRYQHDRRYYPYYPRYYRPYQAWNYPRYYRPYRAWNYCGYGYWPYGCFGSGYYGGYFGGFYGDTYYDREYYPRRERASSKKHVKWCKARYKTYNAKTDTFIGKGRKKYRCNSPYDGRR